jgi:hypothetical protein
MQLRIALHSQTRMITELQHTNEQVTDIRHPNQQFWQKTHCYCCPLKQKGSVQKIDSHNQQTVLRHKLIQTHI